MPAGNGGDQIIKIKIQDTNSTKTIQVILKLIQINDYFSSKGDFKKRYFEIFENPMEVGL
ncbi:MAG TPA: hypothetical protein DEP48_07995 [Persephonella sp.]|uniref:hypothetical protein n=1 Tax=Persephonella TaxID=182899 RepID=UPI00059F9168|nr:MULTISPECIES: hypothetical protein [Persephonella]HCB70285.1 hypothetical protein [Persephonella sp.]